MFKKILIANRGEIAVRVIRACHEMGIEAVAIYSDVDREALHVRFADEAYHVGAPPASESYLVAERIIEVAKACGAEAIHPGYGFLSERAVFVEACKEAGIVFIGPEAEVMMKMGDKVRARQTMQAAGVPIVPGTIEALTDEQAIAFSKEIGLPVMVKASAGGGGKGMRLVKEESELQSSIERARSEAMASFGDDTIYVEKFVEEPRHIEIQILADQHGNVIHLAERECSIQRRHQKVIEEAPANRMTPELREAMGQAAVAAAKAVHYHGAGTCEFLVDKNMDFYFLEMNTRVQVEHAITEEITGVDIVKAMIRVAAGEPLGIEQNEVQISGHAIEARIYAEDPEKGFVPSPGELVVYRPPGGIGVRVDSGVYLGAKVTVFYDPMVAKLVATGRDRPEAIDRMRRALREFAVKGIKTSIPFHEVVMKHPKFIEGHYDTGFIEEHMGGAFDPGEDEEAERVANIMAAIAAYRSAKARAAGAASSTQGGGASEGQWRNAGRRGQMRGGLR
ncbi:MAG: acetyl-CoA carboxylase biotin carboxylase subunit [Deltaproteobacteria bacterium]|nr:acetyl-CoA carboxylase biotin carboxylase subunit [Deltaproteobacteria bacterium]